MQSRAPDFTLLTRAARTMSAGWRTLVHKHRPATAPYRGRGHDPRAVFDRSRLSRAT